MSAMQRTKGQTGERGIAALIRDLTGWNAQRRVRQHGGDSDLLGVPGWAIEVKRHKAAPRGQIARWWRQTVEQAGQDVPVLFYRADRDQWCGVARDGHAGATASRLLARLRMDVRHGGAGVGWGGAGD